MTKLLDKICYLRDILESKNYEKLKFCSGVINQLIEELNRQARKKAKDYSYEIDFTSQDLRELAEDIRNTFKRWENETIPEKVIKKFKGYNELDLSEINENMSKYFNLRITNILPLTRLLCLCEGFGTILYFMELDADDEVAKLTERLI